MTTVQKRQALRRGAKLKDKRLQLIRERAERGYYNSEAVIQEVTQALVETFSSRRAR